MTKAEFITQVQKNGAFETKVAAEKAVNAIIATIATELSTKGTVSLVGLGTFSTVDVAEKTGKIPGTLRVYTKAAHTAPKFKISKTLKDSVANA